MSDPPSQRGISLNETSAEDVRWRLEMAMKNLDDGLPQTALQLLGEARMVIEAMVERWESDKRNEARMTKK